MADKIMVAVQATKRDHYGLTHQPSGDPLNNRGRGLWPADQFTFRMREEGAIRFVDPDEEDVERVEAVGAELPAEEPEPVRSRKPRER